MTLDGDQVPMDALDHARALMAGIEAHPNDRDALDAVRDVLTRMDGVATEAPIPWTTWAEHPDPPSARRWLVRDWLPAGRVALLTGPGGVGKSRLVLQLAAGIASGGDRATPGSTHRIRTPSGWGQPPAPGGTAWSTPAGRTSRRRSTGAWRRSPGTERPG